MLSRVRTAALAVAISLMSAGSLHALGWTIVGHNNSSYTMSVSSATDGMANSITHIGCRGGQFDPDPICGSASLPSGTESTYLYSVFGFDSCDGYQSSTSVHEASDGSDAIYHGTNGSC